MMKRTYRMLNHCKMQHNAEVGLFTKPSLLNDLMNKTPHIIQKNCSLKIRYASMLITPILLFLIIPISSHAGNLPTVDSVLPNFKITSPTAVKEKDYLNIGSGKTFTIEQIDCDILLIEIIGIYCPQCHIQLPRSRKLFFQIKKDSAISKKIKMIAIAVGANSNEATYLKNHLKIPYPVLTDQKFKIHKLIGEPRTPFTMLITENKKIKYVHLGVIKDMDKFYLKIRGLIKSLK